MKTCFFLFIFFFLFLFCCVCQEEESCYLSSDGNEGEMMGSGNEERKENDSCCEEGVMERGSEKKNEIKGEEKEEEIKGEEKEEELIPIRKKKRRRREKKRKKMVGDCTFSFLTSLVAINFPEEEKEEKEEKKKEGEGWRELLEKKKFNLFVRAFYGGGGGCQREENNRQMVYHRSISNILETQQNYKKTPPPSTQPRTQKQISKLFSGCLNDTNTIGFVYVDALLVERGEGKEEWGEEEKKQREREEEGEEEWGEEGEEESESSWMGWGGSGWGGYVVPVAGMLGCQETEGINCVVSAIQDGFFEIPPNNLCYSPKSNEKMTMFPTFSTPSIPPLIEFEKRSFEKVRKKKLKNRIIAPIFVQKNESWHPIPGSILLHYSLTDILCTTSTPPSPSPSPSLPSPPAQTVLFRARKSPSRMLLDILELVSWVVLGGLGVCVRVGWCYFMYRVGYYVERRERSRG